MPPKSDWDTAVKPHVKPSGGKQAGFQSIQGVQKRGAKSYVDMRERQVLRQVSTRLFFGAQRRAKEKGKDKPVEVQMMYAKGNVFIGTNLDVTAESVSKILASRKMTRSTLVDDKFFKSAKSHGGRITARHGKKLGSRMFDDDKQKKWNKGPVVDLASRKRATNILNLVRDIEPEFLDPSDKKSVQTAFSGPGSVYILHSGGKQNGRHVEEKFMDILGHANHTDKTYVGGKMRPCLTCSGRMTHTESQGHDVDFSQNPGKIWKQRYDNQPADVRAETAKLAKNKRTFISKGGSGYGSESDSDGE
ncbi:MAG TPA: hypothetical protein VM571_12995 [Noviherbaspirillum sp.]|nr:hypothetical protein [Noviherbaspirillum sp.]